MEKWADYGISEVRYDSEHTHIVRVKIRPDNGETIGSPTERSRQNIVDAIKKEKTFVTLIKDDEGNWKKGQPVIIIEVNEVEYIKTIDNNSEEDNLENLPEF